MELKAGRNTMSVHNSLANLQYLHFWQTSALQESHLSKPSKLLRNKNTDRTCTRGRDRVFLHACKAVVTCNWSVCSCLCFSSSPLVSLSLASSSLDLISSDSWTGEGGGGRKGSKTRQNPSERQQLKKKCQ